MTVRIFVRDVLPALLWMVVVFGASTHAGGAEHTNSVLDTLLARFFPSFNSHLTWSDRDAIHYYVRKAAHITEYAVLGIFLVRALRHALYGSHVRALWGVAWLLATIYASTDEFHQIFVPGRTPKVTDVMLDSAGALVGVGIMALRRRKAAASLAGDGQNQVQ